MTTTSVKDVTTVMNAVTSNAVNSAGTVSEVSFQSVWNNQANGSSASEEAGGQVSDVRESNSRKVNPQEEALKAKGTARKPVKDTADNAVEENGLDEKQTEEAMEVLGTVAGEMMQQVADTFGISLEELRQMMEELNMDALDILNPEMLGTLLLNVAGAADSMALLTNEALYADFKQLMDMQQQLLAETADELQMSEEELSQMLLQMEKIDGFDTEQEIVSDEPVVEITVSDEMTEEEPVKDDGKADGNVANNLQNAEETLTVQHADGKTQTGNGREQHTSNSNEQTGNLALQELKNADFQPEVSTVPTSTVWDADTQDIMRQIMDYMKIQIKPGVSDLEMQLHPENLGTLQIHMSSKGGVVTANFVTQNEAVKAALESQMIQLKESFAEQGVKVESIEVTVQTHQFERNLDQGRGSNSGEPEKKGRIRRINLNVNMDVEDEEELSQEDALTAEIMTANGNTVDYTA